MKIREKGDSMRGRGKIFLVFVLLFILNSNVFADSFEGIDHSFKGEFLTREIFDLFDDTRYEDRFQNDSRLKIDNKIKFKDFPATAVLNVEARFEYFKEETSRKDLDILLREAYIEVKKEKYSVSLGRQIVTWGKLDDVTLVDKMNPQDYKWLVLFEKQERKDPVFMCKLNWYADNYELEAVFIPFFELSDRQFFGSDWSVFDHIIDGVPAAAKSTMNLINIHPNDSLEEDTISNSQFGLRFRSNIDEVDYDLYYMYLHHDLVALRERNSNGAALKQFLYQPTSANLNNLLSLSPSQNDLTLDREHPRVHIIGGDFETVKGAYGIRGEYAFTFNEPYIRRDFSYLKKDSFSLGLGVDHTNSNNWYYNIQFIQKYIFNYEHLFVTEEFSHQVTATLRKDFLRGNLLFDFDCAYNISYGDRIFNPELTYKFNNGVEMSLGVFVFEGGISTLFGAYNNKDLVYLETVYKF